MKASSSMFALALVVPAVPFAQPGGETLTPRLPAGYHLEREENRSDSVMKRMLPRGQNGDDWTELVTTHAFLGRTASSERFQIAMASAWLELCRDGAVARVTQGTENGYAFSIWSQSCPLNPVTGQPESTWTKAIEGNDGFYLVQKSFRFEPSDAQVQESIAYLGSVTLCDPRLPDRPCPTAPQARR